jgi:hypothetical protein
VTAATAPKTTANAFYMAESRLYNKALSAYTNPQNRAMKPVGPNFPKTLVDPGGLGNIAEARAHRDQFKRHLTVLKQGLKLSLVADPKSELRFIYLRELARLSARDGNLKQLDSDYAGAMTAYLDAYALGQQLWGGKTLLTSMIGVLCEGIGLANADVAVAHLSATEARAALERLEGMLAARPSFPELMATAQAENINRLRLETNPDFSETTQMLGKIPLIRIANDGLITRYRNVTTAQLGVVQRPYQQAKNKLNIELPEYDPLSFFSFNANRILETYTLRTALAQRLVVKLALRVWQAEHNGALPASLDALVTEGYLKALPTDPYSYTGAENFAYDPATGKIWSVGPDGVNNHGKGDDDPLEFPNYGKQKK